MNLKVKKKVQIIKMEKKGIKIMKTPTLMMKKIKMKIGKVMLKRMTHLPKKKKMLIDQILFL